MRPRSKHLTAAALVSRFDGVAEQFTRDIDEAIERDRYVRGDIIVELVRSAVRPGEPVLDFGCGPGRLSLLLARAGFRVRGVDISEAMIARACALDRSGLDLEFETIKESEGLQPESWVGIVCSSVIEYVVDPLELLRQFHTALRAEGALIISYANESSLWRKYWMDTGPPNPLSGYDHKVWNWRGFHALLQQSGFRVAGRPIFFDSPFDRPLWARWFRHTPFAGSLGVVVALPESKGD